jgi:hypothetical protein
MLRYRYFFRGRMPHYEIDTCRTLRDALNTCDVRYESVWPGGRAMRTEDSILVSNVYKPGSVAEAPAGPRGSSRVA